MDLKNEEKDQSNNNLTQVNLATNTFYSFLLNYGSHFFTFVYSFLLARLISDTIWDFLILATSFITIIVIITSLLPPGLNYALNYYIPRYLALNQKSRIKSIIKNAIIIKIAFSIPVFIISILIFSLFADIFAINLEDKVSLLFILSPLIFVNSLNYILDAINRGLSRFNFNFIFLLVKNAIHIIPLLIYFIFDQKIEVEMIALIVMVSGLIPFILNFLLISIMVTRIKSMEDERDSLKKDVSKTFKYGNYIGFADIIERGWKEIQLQGIGLFKTAGAVTGYNIAINYQRIGFYSVVSFRFPLLTSFSSLNTTKNYEQVRTIYKIAYQITLFLLLIISGILFFCVDFVLDFIFLESRLIYSTFLKLFILASVFQILAYFVQTLLNAQHKVKLSFVLQLIYISYYIPLFFIGLIFFGVEGAIIIGLIIGNIISLIIQIISTYKIGKIKLNIKKMIIQYLIFFISLGITIILEGLIFSKISFRIFQKPGFSLFKNFDFLSIGTFLIIFLFLNSILKIVNTTDIKFFESLLNKDRKLDKFMLKTLNLLKRFVRE